MRFGLDFVQSKLQSKNQSLGIDSAVLGWERPLILYELPHEDFFLEK